MCPGMILEVVVPTLVQGVVRVGSGGIDKVLGVFSDVSEWG